MKAKTFDELREQLQQYAKSYFPQFVQNSPADPAQMFLEQVAWAGDAIGHNVDLSLNESHVSEANEIGSLYSHAADAGYKVRPYTAAHVMVDIYQKVPATGVASATRPDLRYCTVIDSGLEIGSSTNPLATFRTMDVVDFTYSSSFDPMEVTVAEYDTISGDPTFYFFKKRVRARSGTPKTMTVSFTTPTSNATIQIKDIGLIDIESVIDSEGDNWYQVDNLSHDLIPMEFRNTVDNYESSIVAQRAHTPWLLEYRKSSKRFVLQAQNDTTFIMRFGSGINPGQLDEQSIPNITEVGSDLFGPSFDYNSPIDFLNFSEASTYGQAPANTTLTIRYLVGNGISDNVSAGSLTNIRNLKFIDSGTGPDANLRSITKSSIVTVNQEPATGGNTRPSVDELRQNIIRFKSAQNRTVEADDYIARVMAMPARLGSPTKMAVVQGPIPGVVDLYVLGQLADGTLHLLGTAAKRNLQAYLARYKAVGDVVNIKDGFIVNLGIDFEIVASPGHHGAVVVKRCLDTLKTMFALPKWGINQPIILSKVYRALDSVTGVQTVQSVKFKCLCGGVYSDYEYDIEAATVQGIIYPSLDPSIFEIKYPDSDIKGRSIALKF